MVLTTVISSKEVHLKCHKLYHIDLNRIIIIYYICKVFFIIIMSKTILNLESKDEIMQAYGFIFFK